MVYTWLDKISGTLVEVERPMREYKKPPRLEETKMTYVEFGLAEWERQVSGGSMLINFGNKGSYGKV